eukprot:603474-Rhodomonas_salina.1
MCIRDRPPSLTPPGPSQLRPHTCTCGSRCLQRTPAHSPTSSPSPRMQCSPAAICPCSLSLRIPVPRPAHHRRRHAAAGYVCPGKLHGSPPAAVERQAL